MFGSLVPYQCGDLPAILSHYVYLSFSFRFPVHLYYPAAVRAFQRHDNPAGTRLPNVTGPFLAPSLRAFHFPYNTTSSPPKYIYCYLRPFVTRHNAVPLARYIFSYPAWLTCQAAQCKFPKISIDNYSMTIKETL